MRIEKKKENEISLVMFPATIKQVNVGLSISDKVILILKRRKIVYF